MTIVDKENPIPYYLQLASILRHKINSGEFSADQLIPSERELCDRYGVSRSTVRQAMQTLKEEGLIWKQRGVGTRIAPPAKIEQNLSGYHDFDLQMIEQGHDVTMTILGHTLLYGSGRAGRLLELSQTDEIFRLDRLRFVDNDPVFLEKIYMPVKRFINISQSDFLETDLFLKKVKEEYDIVLGPARVFLEPVLLHDEECDTMQIEQRPAAGLLFERISLDDSGRPVALTKRIFRGDRCRHLLEIKAK